MVIKDRMQIIDYCFNIFNHACAIFIVYDILFMCFGCTGPLFDPVEIVPLLITLIIVYAYDFLWFRMMTLYDDCIELRYPMRFTHRVRKIKYDNIKKVLYTVPKGGRVFRIYLKDKSLFKDVAFHENAKTSAALSFLNSKGVPIEFGSKELEKKYATWL